MIEPNADAGGLVFRHGRLALGGAAALVLAFAGLAWVDHARALRELAIMREQLCGELPRELLSGLESFEPDVWRAPDEALRALSIVDGLHDHQARARLLVESEGGWRELLPWSKELDWSRDRELLSSVRGECTATLEAGQLRVVRRVQTAAGRTVLLVLERQRE